MLIPDAKKRQWKRNERRSQRRHKTKDKESPLCCNDGHPPHPQVQVHPGECSQEQSQVWKLSSPDEGAAHELPETIDEAGIREESLNWYNHLQSGWRLSPIKSYENEFKIILQYKYHHWIFQGAKRKERKEGVRDVTTRTAGRQTFPLQWWVYSLFRQQCYRSRSNYRYKEIEEGESSNSLTTWAKCKVLNFLVRNAETNFGRQSPSHHYVPVSMLEECVVKVVKENGEDNCSQDNLRTRLRNIWGHKNSDVSSMPREIESNLQTWKFDPIPSESRNWPDENLQRQAAHEKELRHSQAWCSVHQ